MIWSDEFDKDGSPAEQNWQFENGFVRNQELQWYQQQNARCEKGLLIIEGRKEVRLNPGYQKESNDWKKKREKIEYTSSSINTRGRHAWKYGRL